MGQIRQILLLVLLAVLSSEIHGRPEPTDGTSTNPCAAMLCAAETKCVVKQVQCFTTPCNPTAACEPIEKPKNTCDTVRCQEGYKCIMKQVQCVRAPCPPLPECVKY